MGEILTFLRALAGVVSTRRRLALDLGALTDRQLLDIDLDRGDIDAYVRSGRPWPPSPFRPRARLRPSLRGCG